MKNTKLIINSTLPLIIVVILFAVVGQFGISKVTDLRNQIEKARKDQTVLAQKLKLLESISETVAEDSGASLAALPDANPSLIVISQIKNVSIGNGVLIATIKSSPPVEDSGGLSHVSISFETIGTKSQITSFLKSIANIAPITIIDKIKMTEVGGVARAVVTVKSYWSILPKTLPTLTSPITDLTAAEKKTLEDVSALTQPSFVTVPPSEGVGKTDPFSQ